MHDAWIYFEVCTSCSLFTSLLSQEKGITPSTGLAIFLTTPFHHPIDCDTTHPVSFLPPTAAALSMSGISLAPSLADQDWPAAVTCEHSTTAAGGVLKGKPSLGGWHQLVELRYVCASAGILVLCKPCA